VNSVETIDLTADSDSDGDDECVSNAATAGDDDDDDATISCHSPTTSATSKSSVMTDSLNAGNRYNYCGKFCEKLLCMLACFLARCSTVSEIVIIVSKISFRETFVTCG